MMRTVPAAYLIARSLLARRTAVLELLEVTITPGTVARLANNPEHVECGGLLFQAASFEVDGIAEDAEGAIPRLSVTLSNVGREPAAQLEAGFILGQPVTFYLADEADLSALPAGLSWTFIVTSAPAVSASSARFEAGPPAVLHTVPGMVYERSRFPGILPRPPR